MAWRVCSSSAAVAERRRRQRRHLRDTVTVTLTWADGKCQQAVLLNLSTDGVALRLRGRAHIGAQPEPVKLSFALEPGGLALELTARVVSVTPGESPELAVMGMEFDDSCTCEADRAVLRAALGAMGMRCRGKDAI